MQYQFDDFVLDTDLFQLKKRDSLVPGEPQVLELLLYLIDNRGRLIGKEELIDVIWKGRLVSDIAIGSRIKLARKMLGDDGRRQKYIKTQYKKGYIFQAVVTEHVDEEDVSSLKEMEIVHSRSFMDLSNGNTRLPIVVLGFQNIGKQSEEDKFSAGLVEDIVTTLARISKLAVITYPSSCRLEDLNLSSDNNDLRAKYALTGNTLSSGSRVRVSVRLVDVFTGHNIWGQRYDFEHKDILDLQDEITKEVVSALQVELTEGDQALLASRGTENIEAWRLTIEGQPLVLEHHQDGVRRGRLLLEKAVALDKNYALAWSVLAVAHWKESLNESWSDSREDSLNYAISASDRSIEIDPLNPASLAMRSLILISCRRFDEAQEHAEKALYYCNSEATTMALASITLRACCLTEKSILFTRKAMQLCPIYPAWYPYGNAICHWIRKEYDLAIQYAQEAIKIDPLFAYSYFVLIMVYGETGRLEEASKQIDKILQIDPSFSRNAYTQGLPFKDKEVEARREVALAGVGLPE